MYLSNGDLNKKIILFVLNVSDYKLSKNYFLNFSFSVVFIKEKIVLILMPFLTTLMTLK